MMNYAGVLLIALSASDYVHAQLTDSDIRCNSEQSCRMLAGRRVWVKDSAVPVCPTTDLLKNCFTAPINSPLIITGAVRESGGIHWIFAVNTHNGKTGYVTVSNSHLLTFKDPTPAIAAQKRRAGQEAEQKRKQAEADVEAIAATPAEVYEKACILAAAERLPKIPGIEIVGTRAKLLPAEMAKDQVPSIFSRIIEIDAKAAGQSVVYTFLCAKGVRTPAFIQILATQ